MPSRVRLREGPIGVPPPPPHPSCSVLRLPLLAGESKPVVKEYGNDLFAGTINCSNASFQVQVMCTAADSTPARLAALIEKAMAAKSRKEMVVERFAKVRVCRWRDNLLLQAHKAWLTYFQWCDGAVLLFSPFALSLLLF